MYHVLNRGVGRMRLFRETADFAAMEQVLNCPQSTSNPFAR